jgi:hypothetical protein
MIKATETDLLKEIRSTLFTSSEILTIRSILNKYRLAKNDEIAIKKLMDAIKADAIDMLKEWFYDNSTETLETSLRGDLEHKLLNGAENWSQYSWGGCALCYNDQIMKHYLTEDTRKALWNRYNQDNDFSFDFLLDMQADCLRVAYLVIRRAAKAANQL